MANLLILNFLLILFLLLTIFHNQIKPVIPKHLLRTNIRLSPLLLFSCFVVFAGLAVVFILLGPQAIVKWYIRGSFSLLLIGYAVWITLTSNTLTKAIAIAAAMGIIIGRFLYPSDTLHNIFMMLAIVWVGPFFTQIKLITKRRFIIISLVWFVYDIIFVWLTPAATAVNAKTAALGFPLALVVKDSFIGSGDLLWANVLISLLLTNRARLQTIGILVVSNLLLEYLDIVWGNAQLFPLLVLWVPIGLLLLKVFNKEIEQSQG